MSSFSFLDLDRFVEDTPHEELGYLRRNAPVYWHPMPTLTAADDGFWLLTKYTDIVHVERNAALFSSHHGLTLADAPPQNCGAPWPMVRDGLTHLDAPAHTAHKKLVAPVFAVRAIAALENRIGEIAEQIVSRATDSHNFDFGAEIALRFPVAVVLGAVMGLPEKDFDRIIRWSDAIVAPEDPRLPPYAAVDAIHEIYSYGISLLALRRREPREDLISFLAHMKDSDGQPLTDEKFLRYFWSLITGAFDTTASAIAGGMLALIQFADQYDRLLADPSLLPAAVEEMIRWETPTIYFRRTALQETEIGGKAIRPGQRVVMCYASANRDEEVFENPGCFDVARTPNDHLSFGFGRHYCLGSNLARAEIRIVFERILQKRLRLVLSGPIQRARSNFQNRILRMPVRRA